MPARTPLVEDVRRLAVEVFKLVGCSGLARVDFFVTRTACSSTSSTRSRASPRRACTRSCGRRAACDYPELLDRLLELALERHAEERRYRY